MKKTKEPEWEKKIVLRCCVVIHGSMDVGEQNSTHTLYFLKTLINVQQLNILSSGLNYLTTLSIINKTKTH